MVFLYEGTFAHVLTKPLVAESFHEKTAFVAENGRFKQLDIGNAGFNDLHICLSHIRMQVF